MAQEAETAVNKKTTFGEKLVLGTILTALGGGALYFTIGGIGTLASNQNVRLSNPFGMEGNEVMYEERLPANSFWRRFPFVDKDGMAVVTITTPEGGLVARLTDSNNNYAIEKGDIVEVMEHVNGISGLVTYHHDKVVDSDGKTTFTQPTTVLQARILEHGKQERTKWNNWLQTQYPAITAKLREQR